MLRAALALVLLIAPAAHAEPAAPPAPAVVMDELARMAERPLWPGFDPGAYPVAFYTGEATVLYRHPGVPDGFVPAPDGVSLVFPGRHGAMLANTSAEIGGVATATVLLPALAGRSAEQVAALTVHELFHVFAHAEHPAFTANEAALFGYPFADAALYRRRLRESEALHRAVAADEAADRAAWALLALRTRLERFAAMDPDSAAYERGQELNEGLAQYVEDRASGADAGLRFPSDGWPPEQVRQRAYTTGQAIAVLLDELLPGWQQLYADGLDAPLDTVLLVALAAREAAPAAFEAGLGDRLDALAASRTQAYRSGLAEAEHAFLTAPGWHVRVAVAEGANLLGLRGFDPLNVLALGDGKVLHTRMLRLGSDAVELEMVNGRALSYGPNDHALFTGVRWVVLAASARPTISTEGRAVRIEGDGFTLGTVGARVTTDEAAREVRVTVEPSSADQRSG